SSVLLLLTLLFDAVRSKDFALSRRLNGLVCLACRRCSRPISWCGESARVSLRFEPRADRAAQLRVVQRALWRTGDHVGKAAELIGASRYTVSALRAELRQREDESWAPEGQE